ncbi:imidazole glycerol phosphate synthase subunit HisH [uncultured Lamprocystis sp.]|jgi:glutamine amidotransferase|uniref:imidazole glycerol phosphate synthase subunit HisH n=1 Tax=uncultured Lamprocystis sp. TaxID=543132 RepID=UPI0025DDC774|nr:imidazole glycerol phosphate synthase subunit HisH [uncultured Lamprocystis sp.]
MSTTDVVVIDYGVGNLLSVRRVLEHYGANVILTGDASEIIAGRRVVLPGVGAFPTAMQVLNEMQLPPVIREVAARGTPLLGICLGMQLLLDESEEFGTTIGLGLIPGKVRAIPGIASDGQSLKVPHIGWNGLHPAEHADWSNSLLSDIRPGEAVYFVHSFMAQPNAEHRVSDCMYGGHKVSAVVAKDNVIGCQFHPEKSGDVGLRIIKRFLKL